MKNLYLTLILLFVSLVSFSQCENDTIDPWFVNFQYEPTVSCSDDLLSVFPIAMDNCDTLVDIPYIEEIFDGDCPGNKTIFRIYRAYDDSGNGVIETQTIHVVDETAPTFEPIPTLTINCGETPVFNQPIVIDNCGFIAVTNEDFVDLAGNCQIVYTRVWTAYDQCGNTSNSSQTIIVTDMIAPVITGPIYLEVNEGDNIDTLFVTVTDNCSTFTITYLDSEVSGNNVIRNYTATDACGNESTFEQIIKINVTTPPGDDDDEDDDEDDEEDDDEDDDKNGDRIAICHVEGNGSYHTIYVNQNAVQHHLDHGDYLGPCTQIIMDWNEILPNSGIEMKVVKDYDNKYKKYVKIK
jgi:hypothetical protein